MARDTKRQCLVTRQVLPADQLFRFVLDGEGRVTFDLKARLPGRGVWVTSTRENVDLAVKRGLFARGFKQACQASETLGDEIDALMETRTIDMLSMARKAGELITGFMKVEAALRGGKVQALVQASDGSADQIEKIQRVARHQTSLISNGDNDPQSVIPVERCFNSEQLGLAIGGTHVIHAALLHGSAAAAAWVAISRLLRFRNSEMSSTE